MRYFVIVTALLISCSGKDRKIFDAHLHGDPDLEKQFQTLHTSGVYEAAVSSGWEIQQGFGIEHNQVSGVKILHGLFIPCPLGKVPYSQQKRACYENGNEWPEVAWVEQQIKEKKINFMGEVLTQYYGISSSDTLMYPYYALAEKYNIPVGLHTGSAGPDHGCPDFKEEMGNPLLLQSTLNKFPKLRVWLMHAGAPFVKEFIEMMKANPGLYADISVLNNPMIIPPADFSALMKSFIDAGLEDRLMFGTDNADIETTTKAIEQLEFVSAKQKEKLFFKNAERFFH